MSQQLVFPVAAQIADYQKILRDEIGVVFDVDSELLPTLNLALSQICNDDPQALVKNVPYQLAPFRVAVAAAGALYVEGDQLTVIGGTVTRAARLLVGGTSGGAVDLLVATDYGAYTSYPANPVSLSGGAGSGAQANLQLVGSMQEIPPDGINLVSIRRNLGVDGQTFGDVIEEVQIDELTACRPGWAADICGVNGAPAAPVHWLTVKEAPKQFYLWPYPNVKASPWWVDMIYRAVPDTVGIGDSFPLAALYMPAARYFTIANVMLRLDQNDQRFAKCVGLAEKYLALYDRAMGLGQASIETTKPPHRLNRKAAQ